LTKEISFCTNGHVYQWDSDTLDPKEIAIISHCPQMVDGPKGYQIECGGRIVWKKDLTKKR